MQIDPKKIYGFREFKRFARQKQKFATCVVEPNLYFDTLFILKAIIIIRYFMILELRLRLDAPLIFYVVYFLQRHTNYIVMLVLHYVHISI